MSGLLDLEQELRNCTWGQDWKLIDQETIEIDESRVLVPSSHPDSDAELEKEPVIAV